MATATLQSEQIPPPPSHVAIIMDGNGRWARSRGLPRVEGHRRGAEAVRRTITAAAKAGVSYLTLFGFSSENWKRSSDEVQDLMGLLKYYLNREVTELHKNNVRFRVIGDRARLGNDIVNLIERAEEKTDANTGLTLILALSYGGRAELAKATRAIAQDVADGRITVEQINEDVVASRLYSQDIPDPDLLIRTSGEHRISNFLLWQLAYAEFVFIDTLWPDFTEKEFNDAIVQYLGRERRFGATQ